MCASRYRLYLPLGFVLCVLGCEQQVGEEHTILYGLHLSTPQVYGGSATLMRNVSDDEPALAFQVVPGTGGGKVSVGRLTKHGMDLAPDLRFVKLCVMRTWGEPVNAEPDQTYVGVEFQHAPLVPIGVYMVGVFAHVDGDDGEHDLLVSAGVAFAF